MTKHLFSAVDVRRYVLSLKTRGWPKSRHNSGFERSPLYSPRRIGAGWGETHY